MERPTEEEINATRGDQYAKRLLVRKKDLNQSFESFSKSLRRRKKIMDAITTAVAVSSEAETANAEEEEAEQDKSYVSTWPEDPVDNCDPPTVLSGDQGKPPARSRFDPDGIHLQPHYSRDAFLAGLLNYAQPARPTELQPKSSHGHNYQSAKSNQAGMRRKKKAKPEQQQLMNARILQILEPEVVHVESRFAASNELQRPSAPPESDLETPADSTLPSFVSPQDSSSSSSSSSSKELDRQMDNPHLQPREQLPPETPKGRMSMYPSLDSMEKRMSEHYCTKKLFFESARSTATGGGEQMEQITDKSLNAQRAVTCTVVDESSAFGTPMPMTTRLDGPADQWTTGGCDLGSASNGPDVCFPRTRGKPNLESTRKQHPAQMWASQHGTSISTITMPNTPSSFAFGPCADVEGKGIAMCTVPLEVENFLKLALGEKHYDMSAFSVQHCTNAADRDTLGIMEMTAAVDQRPSALDRSLSFCKTLSNSIKRRFKSPRGKRRNFADEELAKQQQQRLQQEQQLRGLNGPKVRRLLDLLEVYQTQIYQASKALDLCNRMHEFQASSERVEVERLLLVANLGKLAVREEFRRTGEQPLTSSTFCERAEVTIEELSVPLREDLLRRSGGSDDCVEWFVLVVSEGLHVWASQAVACPVGDPRIHFPGSMFLPEVAPDFRLSIGVYSMRLRPWRYNHEDKYHIERPRHDDDDEESSWPFSCPCPSPRRLLSPGSTTTSRSSVRSPKQYHVSFSGVRQSAFVLHASLELTLYQLGQAAHSAWPLRLLQRESTLRASLGMQLRCRLRLSVRHAGFLTHANDEPGGIIDWSRRWCVLEGRSLLFWNYPHEQEDDKLPVHSIDLLGCQSQRIELAERSLCPRPRTLIIETARKRNPVDEDSMVFQCRRSWTIVRNLLSCDTQRDLIEWQSKLNHVVSALYEWNLLAVSESLQVSDL